MNIFLRKALERHQALAKHQLDIETGRGILASVQEALVQRNYLSASHIALKNNHWFLVNRIYFKDEFNYLWLRLRNRINMMVSLQSRLKERAQGEVEKIREQALSFIEMLANIVGNRG